jgi:hypothetical protein
LFWRLWSLILDTVGGYACEVWHGCFEREVAKLEKVQLESARIVTGLTQFASRDSLYYDTGWEPLSCRRKSRKLTTFYKMHNKVYNELNLHTVHHIDIWGYL